MKQITLRAMRAFSTLQLLSLLLISCATISAMNTDNMFGMYDASDSSYDSGDNSYSYDSDGQTTAESSFDSAHLSDSDQSCDEIGKASELADTDSEDDNELMTRDYGLLHRSVNHLTKESNDTPLIFVKKGKNGNEDELMSDEEIKQFSPEWQRLQRRMDYVRKRLNGERTTKRMSVNKGSLLEPLGNQERVTHYDLFLDASLNPKNNKTEMRGHINVAKWEDVDDDLVIADVEGVLQKLEDDFKIKAINFRLFDK